MTVFGFDLGIVRDIASAVTPIVVAVVGWLINKSIQKQNRVAERDSHLVRQWADEFSLLAKDVNDTATNILFGYWRLKYLESMGWKTDDYVKQLSEDVLATALKMERMGWDLDRFTPFAPKSGPEVKKAWEQLNVFMREWFKNKGGNTDRYKELQINFNQSARKMHQELLKL